MLNAKVKEFKKMMAENLPNWVLHNVNYAYSAENLRSFLSRLDKLPENVRNTRKLTVLDFIKGMYDRDAVKLIKKEAYEMEKRVLEAFAIWKAEQVPYCKAEFKMENGKGGIIYG